jgi:hypothetical protein
MAGNANFDSLITSTLARHRSELSDVITNNQALFAQLKAFGFIAEEDGSRNIVENLLYGQNSTVASFDGYDILDVTPQEGITAAEYEWKQLAGTVSISGREQFQNSGSKQQIFNLLRAKIRQLEISMQLTLNTQLFSDGTGNGGKDITGLNVAVEDGGAWSTFGNIDSSDATNSWWRNQWADFSGTSFETTSGKSTEGVKQMRTIVNSASRGKDRPTLIVTAQEVFEAYMATLEDKRRFTDGTLGDLGFKNVLFDDVPLVWDEDTPTDDTASDFTAFILNARYLRYVIGRGRNFTSSPFMTPANQDASVSKVLLYSNLVMSNRARQGRLTNITV